jgi:cell division protein FtsW (lipid II flippase)
MPPFAEFAVLQFQILSGGDRYANLVQWLSMAGVLFIVALIAKRLDPGKDSGIVAAVIAATIPMGILQSTTTQTDYVVVLWLACAVYLLLLDLTHPTAWNKLLLGIALGLAILTKPTAYFVAVPFAGWYVLRTLSRQPAEVARAVVIVGASALVLNLGHYSRNVRWVGNPIGPSETTDWARVDRLGVDITLSNVVRGAAPHLGTRSSVNDALEKVILEIHDMIGISINEPASSAIYGDDRLFEIRRVNTDEDHAGNFLHFLLAVAATFVIFCSRRLRKNKELVAFLVSVALAIVISSSYLKWDPWRQRFHLTFFVLLAPVIAVALTEGIGRQAARAISVGLLLASVPWLVSMKMTPLYPIRAFSHFPSILKTDRLTERFYRKVERELPLREATEILLNGQCRHVGLVAGTSDWEYQLWALLSDAQPPFRITHSDPIVRPPGTEVSVPCTEVVLGRGLERFDLSHADRIQYESEYLLIVVSEPAQVSNP